MVVVDSAPADDQPFEPQYDILFGRERRNGSVGDGCRNSDHCKPDLCCLQRNAREPITCRPLSRNNQRCSDRQIKGGYYFENCPCRTGFCDAVSRRGGICRQQAVKKH